MKTVVFSLIVAILMAMTSGTYAQNQNRRGGEFYVGQPRQVDIEKKIELLNEQIEQKKDNLQQLDRDFLFWSRSTSLEATDRMNEAKAQRTTLLASVQKLEAYKDSLLIHSTLDGEQLYFAGNARSITEAATAYAIVRTMDDNGGQLPERFTGILVNYWNSPVTAKVKGPGNFYREIILPAGSQRVPTQREFKFSIPGQYTVAFESQYGSKCVTKPGGMPNVVYYDDAGTTTYDFRAVQYGN